MIPRSAITHWNKQVPWEDIANVEQDLIITRALTDIFADEFLAKELAFRGGTALHKLYLSPQPRYSEDIDLVTRRTLLYNRIVCEPECHSVYPDLPPFRGTFRPGPHRRVMMLSISAALALLSKPER